MRNLSIIPETTTKEKSIMRNTAIYGSTILCVIGMITPSVLPAATDCTGWPNGTQVGVTATNVIGYWIKPLNTSTENTNNQTWNPPWIVYFDGSKKGGQGNDKDDLKAAWYSFNPRSSGSWKRDLTSDKWTTKPVSYESLTNDTESQIELVGKKYCLYTPTMTSGTSTKMKILLADDDNQSNNTPKLSPHAYFWFDSAAMYELSIESKKPKKTLKWAATTTLSWASTTGWKWEDIDPTGATISDSNGDVLLMFYTNKTTGTFPSLNSTSTETGNKFLKYIGAEPPNRLELLITTSGKKTLLLGDDDESNTTGLYNFKPQIEVSGILAPFDPTLVNRGAPPPPP